VKAPAAIQKPNLQIQAKIHTAVIIVTMSAAVLFGFPSPQSNLNIPLK
jgi:hypothetical protein